MKLHLNHTYATSAYADGKWHPAILTRDELFYWPNITQHTQQDAVNWAGEALANALKAAQAVVNEWNVVKSETGHTL